MAAPVKQGLDYFRHSVGLLKDRKLRAARMKYGYIAQVIYIALLEMIYADKGYYIKYDDNLIWDLMEYLQGKHSPDAETVREVVGSLTDGGLFSADLIKVEVLTSRRLQREYYTATVDRKAVDIDFSIWLLTEEEMEQISERSNILAQFRYSADIRPNNPVNRPNNPVIQPNNPQSREEKSRVEYSRVEYSTGNGGSSAADEADGFAENSELMKWFDSLAIPVPPRARNQIMIDYLRQGVSRSLVEYAANECAKRETDCSYLIGILRRKVEAGITDAQQLPKYQRPKAPIVTSYDGAEFDQRGFTLPEKPADPQETAAVAEEEEPPYDGDAFDRMGFTIPDWYTERQEGG